MKTRDTISICADWIERFVIGLTLCPFAAKPWEEGRVRLVALEGNAKLMVKQAMEEAFRLRHTDADMLETTVLILKEGLDVFEHYLDLSAVLEQLLEEGGFVGELQLATFHPYYRFEGADPDDPANFTNRSPLPLWHLIREESVARAVASHPDPEGIPARNQKLLRDMGHEGIRRLLENNKA